MIRITPRQLEAFVTTVATDSVRAASEHLNLTQPAVSMAISELEAHLGTHLFSRDRGRLHLNDRGQELLPLAREIIDRLYELQRTAAGQRRQLSGQLVIGASNTVGNYLVSDLLSKFVNANPGVSIHLHVENTHAIVAAVREHRFDLGCVEGPVSGADLEVKPWRRDELVLCASPRHPLARCHQIEPESFRGAHWLLREPGSATRALSDQILGTLPPGATVLEFGQIEAVKQAIAAGLGVGFLPLIAVSDAVHAHRLKILETPFLKLGRWLSLVIRRDKYRGAVIDTFLTTVTIVDDSKLTSA